MVAFCINPYTTTDTIIVQPFKKLVCTLFPQEEKVENGIFQSCRFSVVVVAVVVNDDSKSDECMVFM